MSMLTKAFPGLSKKNLGKTLGKAVSSLLPGGGMVAQVLDAKTQGKVPALSIPAYTGGGQMANGGQGNIITDLFGRVGDAAQGAFDGVVRRLGGGTPVPSGTLPMAGGAFPVSTAPLQVTALRAPKGYVLVTNPMTGQKIAVLKQVAYALGLRKRPHRAEITARDMRGAMRVQSFIKRHTVQRHPKVALKTKTGRKR